MILAASHSGRQHAISHSATTGVAAKPFATRSELPVIDAILEIGKPLLIHRETVPPEWIDYNGHMNVAYYALAFDHAADALFDHVGLDDAYRRRTGISTFALEAHFLYRRELRAGDRIRCEIQMLDLSDSFFHYINKMYHDDAGYFAASAELISCVVDLGTRRMTRMPAEIAARFAAIRRAHEHLPKPAEAGRVIAIRKKG